MRYFISTLLLLLLPTLAWGKEDPAKTKSAGADLVVVIGGFKESVSYATYAQWTTPESVLALDKNYRSEIENTSGCPEKRPALCALFLSQRARMHLRLVSTTSPNTEEIRRYVTALAAKTDVEPADATFKMENGQVTAFSAEQSGKKLDTEKSFAQLLDLFSHKSILAQAEEISLPFSILNPDITTGEANNLGISKLIGEGKSNFKGSTASRIHNIKTAMARFNGILIKPGEEFSFVQTLGDVDGEHGYLPELVIKKDKTEPEFGGGVCQVSTTMFRAAIYSGLKITARRNHAYPVSYYNPQGMDSTIYVPKPDLKFVNNTPGTILVQPKIVGTELTFSFYGTDDGRKVEIDGPYITESNPDRSLKTTFGQKVTAADGSVMIDDTFKSAYDSPYKYPHPGDPMLAAKPANWTDDEWNTYKRSYRDANPLKKKK